MQVGRMAKDGMGLISLAPHLTESERLCAALCACTALQAALTAACADLTASLGAEWALQRLLPALQFLVRPARRSALLL